MSRVKNLRAQCPHCGGQVDFPADIAGQLSPCPHCHSEMELLPLLEGPEEDSASRTGLWWAIIGIAIMVLALGIAIAGLIHLKHKADHATEQSTARDAGSQQPGAQAKGLVAGAVQLESAPGNTLVYATGSITNDSPVQRFGIRVRIALLDEAGRIVGHSTDYRAVLEPGERWDYRAMVMVADATSARVEKIFEDQ